MSTSTHMQHVITDHLSSRRWRWRVRLPGFNARRAGGSSTLLPSHLRCFRSPLPVLLSPPFCFCHFWLSGTFLHGTYGTDLHRYVVGVQRSTPVSLCVASRNRTNSFFCPLLLKIYREAFSIYIFTQCQHSSNASLIRRLQSKREPHHLFPSPTQCPRGLAGSLAGAQILCEQAGSTEIARHCSERVSVAKPAYLEQNTGDVCAHTNRLGDP